MKIGIFVVEVGRKAGGPETYEVQLVRALARIDQVNEYFVYCTHKQAIPAIGVRQDNFVFRVLSPSSRLVSLSISLPAMMLKDKVKFFHSTMVPPPVSPKPYLLSILCVSNWSHPEFYPNSVRRRLNFLLGIGIKKATYLLCNSHNVVEELKRRFHISPERLAVTHLGVGEEFSPKPQNLTAPYLVKTYGLDYPYILFVGKHQERKNVFRVMQAYARYVRESRSDDRLVLIGRAAHSHGPIHQALSDLGIADRVTRIPYVPYSDLPELYSGAKMFVFPSLWEGFGLPVIESMACGTPVITSNVTSLPEIAGDAAVIVNPESVDEIYEGMMRIETSPQFRSDIVNRGIQRARQFTWRKCAENTLAAYTRMSIQ